MLDQVAAQGTSFAAGGPNGGALSLETVACGLCGSSSYATYETVGQWTIVKCKQCGFCFTNPRPTPECLTSFYTLDYFRGDEVQRLDLLKADGSFKASADTSYDQRLLDIESNTHRSGSLLEIGAATGVFLKLMENRGWKVRGIELSRDAVEVAKKNEQIDIFCGRLEEFRTQETFDVICMYQSLEHLPDPAYVIGRAYELLNAGGLIVIEVPNLNGFDIKISKARKLQTYDLPLHLSHFTPQVLSAKLEETGFSIIDLDLYHPGFILKAVKQRERNRRNASVNGNGLSADATGVGHSDEQPPLALKPANWKSAVLKSISRFFPGWRFTIVARK